MMPNPFSKFMKPKRNVRITSINLKFMGNVHGMDGFSVPNKVFEINIPFQNKMGSQLLPDDLKGPKIQLTTVLVSEPFALIDISPKLPMDVDYMSKMTITLKIRAPDMNYEGPLEINFGNESKDAVTISIKGISMSYKDKTIELPDSGGQLNLQKNQIFMKSVQLYNILSYMDTVSAIEVNEPFSLVSTDPRLPTTADKKDSFVVSLYIKAPQYSYAGSLEVKIR